jgi:hypothetical protein
MSSVSGEASGIVRQGGKLERHSGRGQGEQGHIGAMVGFWALSRLHGFCEEGIFGLGRWTHSARGEVES